MNTSSIIPLHDVFRYDHQRHAKYVGVSGIGILFFRDYTRSKKLTHSTFLRFFKTLAGTIFRNLQLL